MDIKRINENTIIKRMSEKLGIPIEKISDAVDIIINTICNDLIRNQAVSISNFGTLNPYVKRIHKANDIRTNEIRMLNLKKSIKFIPHAAVRFLLKNRKYKFRNFEEKELDE